MRHIRPRLPLGFHQQSHRTWPGQHRVSSQRHRDRLRRYRRLCRLNRDRRRRHDHGGQPGHGRHRHHHHHNAGVNSAASLAAQSGTTKFLTADGAGNLATGAYGPADIANLQSSVGTLQSEISTNQTEARAGTALALASAGLQYDTRPGKVSVAAAVGFFKGQSGLASGLGYALDDKWRLNASFTASPQVADYGFTLGSSWTLN
jgi:autotransporter adhesin